MRKDAAQEVRDVLEQHALNSNAAGVFDLGVRLELTVDQIEHLLGVELGPQVHEDLAGRTARLDDLSVVAEQGQADRQAGLVGPWKPT
jgi:hypothetical protein